VTSFVEAQLVNEPFGDPGLYLDFRFGRRALLFDLGDVGGLPPRKLLRISHVFVSHAHMDHFSGFDRLLRVCLGRPAPLALFGPPGFTTQVAHRLAAYSWNLIADKEIDFVISVAELHGTRLAAAAEFHTRDAFVRRDVEAPKTADGILLDEDAFLVRAATLDHGIPSLAFAFEEKLRINVWKEGLDRLGLPVGPWLDGVKDAIRRGDPDTTQFRVSPPDAGGTATVSLQELREHALRIVPGRKLAYVVDTAYHQENARRIVDLARDAERLYIEAMFLARDTELAAKRRHLTAAQAGLLARRAGVSRLFPFHFSPRYLEEEEALRREAEEAFHAILP